jgi:7-cyano-7-deazaguanine synthase in queuosine biosynthesis
VLRETLEFLTEDNWTFDFVELTDPPSIRRYLGLRDNVSDDAGGTSVVLFSGGLDSLAGAVQELNTTNRHVVLLSRQVGGLTDKRQQELAAKLREGYPRRVTHVPVSAGLTKETSAVEHTQRSRSFLFSAVAMVAAVIEGSDRIRFFENGIMSVNLPISAQVVGTRASRSTHPRSLRLLNDLAHDLVGGDLRIDNPFVWKTKVEVVRELLERPEGRLVGHTLSCSNTRGLDTYKPHCGKCAQCLQRRISTLGAGATDLDDPPAGYKIDLLEGPRQDGQDRAMAIDTIRSAMEFRQLSEEGFAIKFAAEFGWLITSFHDEQPEDVALKAIAMFKCHGDAVRDIFVRATEARAAALVDKTLPSSSLLRTWHEDPEFSVFPTGEKLAVPAETTKADDAVELPDFSPQNVNPSEYVLAIDESNKWILVEGIGAITSRATFPLMAFLLRSHKEDLEQGLLPENYRAYRPEEIADELGIEDSALVRQHVKRFRKALAEGFSELGGIEPEANDVIEAVRGKRGYRINPRVRLVALDQFQR